MEVFRDRSGGYRWRLRAGNGQIVASGESHTQRSDARRAWNTVDRLITNRHMSVVTSTARGK